MFSLVIAALVTGIPLPYAELIKVLEGEQGSGPEVELDGEEF
jgi:hypothetical protein